MAWSGYNHTRTKMAVALLRSSRFGKVRFGQWVSRGQKVGEVGNTGNAIGRPTHLHYSIMSLIPYPNGILLKHRAGNECFISILMRFYVKRWTLRKANNLTSKIMQDRYARILGFDLAPPNSVVQTKKRKLLIGLLGFLVLLILVLVTRYFIKQIGITKDVKLTKSGSKQKLEIPLIWIYRPCQIMWHLLRILLFLNRFILAKLL